MQLRRLRASSARVVSDCIAIFSRRIRANDEDVRVRRDDSRDVSDSRREVSPSAYDTVLDFKAVVAFSAEDKIGIRDTNYVRF